MAKPIAKTVTAAPKKQAKVQVTILSKATGKPMAGVAGLLVGTDGTKLFTRNLGKSDGLGRLRFTQDVGHVDIQISRLNHAGEGLPTLPGSPNTTIVFSGLLEEGKRDFSVTMLQVRAQVTLVVSEAPGGPALGGVKVKVGSEVGITDHKGRYVTQGLGLGVKHKFELTRNGHGPASGTAVGAVTHEVDLTGLTQVSDQTVTLEMKNVWGKVKSSSIQIDGDKFTVWFPKFAAKFPATHPTLKTERGDPAPTFPFAKGMGSERAGAPAYRALFDDMAKWFGPSMTLEEFVAIFMIVSNETGGTYKPVSEIGSLSYMFYLNKGTNRRAGDQLAERGLLTDKARILAWNAKGSKNFPGVGTDGITEDDLKECDFWKYRGHGFVQTTNRTNYLERVDPVLKAAGLKVSDELTSQELDDAVLSNDKVYIPLLAKEISARRGSLAKANAEQWKPFGYDVASTTNHTYVALYEWRCQELYKELRSAAEGGRLVLA